MPETFELYRGESLLGTITANPALGDFPWFGGTFTAAPGFEDVRRLFDEELRLLREIRENEADEKERWSRWGAIWEEIQKPGLRLEQAGDPPITELLIHVDGENTWWRS